MQTNVHRGVGLLLMALIGCKSAENRGSFVPYVFGSLRYVGEYPAGHSYPALIAETARKLPPSFEAHTQYVFQPIGEVDSIEFATKTLPEALRKAGVTVTAAPRNSGDFATPSLGGPVWEIGFKQARYLGTIHNRLNRLLYERNPRLPAGSNDDVIIIFDN